MIVAKTRLKKMPKTCRQCDYRALYPVEGEDICRIYGSFCPWKKKTNGLLGLGKPDWCPLMEVAPTIDAVEVVRCRDCINYNTDNCCDGFGWCENLGIGVHDNFFCKIGERKGR